jgi:Domain of unknown function (DUF4148)
MNRTFISAFVVASALVAPAFAFAQSNGPVTRAEVKAELVQLEMAGYKPSSDHTTYPRNIQAAEARVATQNAAATSYGGSFGGTSDSGGRVTDVEPIHGHSIYSGH